jgi:hypothetical protein
VVVWVSGWAARPESLMHCGPAQKVSTNAPTENSWN